MLCGRHSDLGDGRKFASQGNGDYLVEIEHERNYCQRFELAQKGIGRNFLETNNCVKKIKAMERKIESMEKRMVSRKNIVG